MSIKEAAKPVLQVAIHPSGYYMAAAFINSIQIYHILHDELRKYKVVEIKNSTRIKFNEGGNLFIAIDNRSVNIFNAYTLERIHKISTPPGVTDVRIAKKDDNKEASFAIVTSEGFIGHWLLNTYECQQGVPERNFCYQGCDYISQGLDDLLVVVGTDGFKTNLRMIKIDGAFGAHEQQFHPTHIQKSIAGDEGKFTQVQYIKTPKNKIQAIITGSEKGTL